MNCALLDDDILFHKLFSDSIVKNQINGKIDYYSLPESFLLNIQKYDAVFLDIDLQDKNGIDISKSIKKMHHEIIIIFVTAHKEYIYDAFGLNVLAFIDKADLNNRIQDVWQRLHHEIELKKSVVLTLIDNTTLAFPINAVLYCETIGRKIYVSIMGDKSYRLKNMSLAALYSMFSECPFIYVNRSCFVNIQNIESLKKDCLFVLGRKEPIYISRDKIRDVKKAFLDYHTI